MTKKDMQHYREKLLEMGRAVEGVLADLNNETRGDAGASAANTLSKVPFHLADLASDQTGQDTALSLLDNEQQMLVEINNALQRIDAGTYGTCEECGREISKGRLDVLPYARHCIDCADELQRAGGMS